MERVPPRPPPTAHRPSFTNQEGEQISFDYTTTEWDMGAPFTGTETSTERPSYLRSLFRQHAHEPVAYQRARLPRIQPEPNTTHHNQSDAVTGKTCQGFKHLPAAEKLARLREGVLPSHIMRLWIEHELLPQEGPRDGSVKTGE